jgi:precorrin-3B synthase
VPGDDVGGVRDDAAVIFGCRPDAVTDSRVEPRQYGKNETLAPLEPLAIVGVGLPFGRIVAEDLAQISAAANIAGATELRLTPWRTILVPVASVAAASQMVAGLPERAFILDRADTRLRIAACPGAPACERGTTPVREDAARLAVLFAGVPGNGTILHVSGCGKGCAHPRRAPVTLVARQGRYDLVRDGNASDVPAAQGLTMDQAIDQVRRFMAYRAGKQSPRTESEPNPCAAP